MEEPDPEGIEGDEVEKKETLKARWDAAKKDVLQLGGWEGFKSGAWLLRLVQRCFRNYYERAHADYFRTKYPSLDSDALAQKLTKVAARNASLLGAFVGAAVSADEIVALITAGEGGVGLPANIAIAFAAIAGEAVLLVRMQLQLVANLAKLYGVPLDPDDPEDILTILAFAVGGSAAEAAGKLGMKVGGRLTERAVRKYVSKELLAAIKSLGQKIGFKILQRTIIKYAVPLASMVIGAGWNYLATRAVGKIARKHLLGRLDEGGPPGPQPVPAP